MTFHRWYTNTRDGAESALSEAWKTEAERTTNGKKAFAVAQRISESTGLSASDIDAMFGNNAAAIIAMAALHDQLAPTKAAPPATPREVPEHIRALQASEAYTNASHPDHERVSGEIRAAYESTFTEPLAR